MATENQLFTVSTIVLFTLFPKKEEPFKFFFSRKNTAGFWLLPWQPEIIVSESSLDRYKRCLKEFDILEAYACSRIEEPSFDYDFKNYLYTIFIVPVTPKLKSKLYEAGDDHHTRAFLSLNDIDRLTPKTKEGSKNKIKPFYDVEIEIILKFLERRRRLMLH